MADPVRRLAEVAKDLGPALLPSVVDDALAAIVAAARVSFDAAAVSVALLDEEAGDLRYLAATGHGADAVVGMRLPLGAGIAGYVAATGQSLTVGDVRADPRFAGEVAERTGYVPRSMTVVPVADRSERVLGVLSILDPADGRDLAMAAPFADAVAAVLPVGSAAQDLGTVLLRAIADAVAEGDRDLAASLRRRVSRGVRSDPDVVRLAAAFAELRDLGDREQHTALELVETFARFARPRRRR